MTTTERQYFNLAEIDFATALLQTAEFAADSGQRLQLGVGLNISIQRSQEGITFNRERVQSVELHVGGHPDREGNFTFKYNAKTPGAECTDFWTDDPASGASRSELSVVEGKLTRVFSRRTGDAAWMPAGNKVVTPDTILHMAQRTAVRAEAVTAEARPVDARRTDKELWVPQSMAVPVLARTVQIAAHTALESELTGTLQARLRLLSGAPDRLLWHARGRGVSGTEIVGIDPEASTEATFTLTARPDTAVENEGASAAIVASLVVKQTSGEQAGAVTRYSIAEKDGALVRAQQQRAAGRIGWTHEGEAPATTDTILDMAHFAAQVAIARPETIDL